MWQYIFRRLLQVVPILLGISLIVFLTFLAMPGDPFASLIDPNISPNDIAAARSRLGLDDAIHIQYFRWLGQAAQGNLGWSLRYKEPVAKLMQQRLGPTFLLAATALCIALVLGVPFGVISATRTYSWFDHGATAFAFFGLSIPNFFFGLLLIKLLALQYAIFPSSGMVTAGKNLAGGAYWVDVGHHMILPALVLGLTLVAGMMRYTRSSMLEVVRQDYVRTARAKGLAERVVVYKHALRNAMIPVVTILALLIPALMSGAIITEWIFTWPGLGQFTYTAFTQRDYPVMMGTTMFFAVLTLLFNLLADIFYAVVDPRIRYD